MTRNFVVVGGLSGIGKSVVDILSSCPDTSIITTSRDPSQIFSSSNVSVHNLDLAVPDSISSFLSAVCNHFHSIDGLVLCAGFIKTSPALMASESLLLDHLQVNFLSQLQILQFLVRKRMQ